MRVFYMRYWAAVAFLYTALWLMPGSRYKRELILLLDAQHRHVALSITTYLAQQKADQNA